jgi:hypothetical protein
MDATRRTTLTTVAACAAAAAGLWLLFGVLLEPVRDGCNTSLVDSPYKTWLVPAHLAAAGLVTAALWRRGPRPVLIAVWVVIAACLVVPGLFSVIGFVAIFAGPLIGLPALFALAIAALVTVPRPDRWARFAPMATVLGWGALALGIPASLGYYWLEAVSVFCF